ncbi:MAG: hypothetical protein A2W35_02000 [Chloroflexi bacterium RBG_16_57_11]|nr:MAG: hypothetical protein A2W35_02000 [Chloroflexi bacterium RBG_16_57_11]
MLSLLQSLSRSGFIFLPRHGDAQAFLKQVSYKFLLFASDCEWFAGSLRNSVRDYFENPILDQDFFK